MLARLSLNSKRNDCNHTHQNSHFNEKQNNQKNLNRGKKSARLSQLDPCLIVKPIDQKNYLTNADNKLNLSLNYNSTQPVNEFKTKISSRNSLQRNRIESLIPNQKSKSNTQQFIQLYGKDILTQHELKPIRKPDFLKNHEVNPLLRARMLDWMVEVMKSYKFINKSYFAGVQLLDRYFIENKQKVPVSQLHISGVTAMYIATKMEQIYPLKVKTVYEKIVHKKISKQALIQMQANIFNALDHKVNSWTFFDLAILKISDQFQNVDQSLKTRLEDIIAFVSKCILYDYDLYIRYDMQTFSKILVRIATGICKLTLRNQIFSVSCHQDVTKSYRSFKTSFKGLSNIFKFTDEKVIGLVDSYFFEEKTM